MNDLIKKQDAIDVLFEWYETPMDQDVVDVICNVPPAQQWILCSERLPDEDGYYLVLYDIYFINGDFAQRSVKVDQFFKELNAFCERFGIAWMPLPEFPRRPKNDID